MGYDTRLIDINKACHEGLPGVVSLFSFSYTVLETNYPRGLTAFLRRESCRSSGCIDSATEHPNRTRTWTSSSSNPLCPQSRGHMYMATYRQTNLQPERGSFDHHSSPSGARPTLPRKRRIHHDSEPLLNRIFVPPLRPRVVEDSYRAKRQYSGLMSANSTWKKTERG
jgi:hypothetical protein